MKPILLLSLVTSLLVIPCTSLSFMVTTRAVDRGGDFDGDGKADLIAIQPQPNRFVVWTSSASSFATGHQWAYEQLDYSGEFFRVADFTGDGKSDLVAIKPTPSRFVVWTSNGSGFNTGSEWSFERLNYYGQGFLSGDVDGDGKADLVAVQGKPSRFVVWTSTGSGFNTGSEWNHEQLDYSGQFFLSADVNGDGKADLIAIQFNPSRIVVWTSNGSAFTRGREWSFERLNYTGQQFLSGDVNGDGKADLIAIQRNPSRFVVWTSNGSAFTRGREWSFERLDYLGHQFLSADVNGDGEADVIAIQVNPSRFVVWTSTGSAFNRGRQWSFERLDYSHYGFVGPSLGFYVPFESTPRPSDEGFDTSCIGIAQFCRNYHYSNGNKVWDGLWYPCGVCFGIRF
jgi:hypothetical protein